MRKRAGLRATVLTAAAAGILLLVGAAGATAGEAPSLASTAQYKAFIEYVKKLDGQVGQGTSSAQKGAYEAELTTKKEAAAHKANALFKRSSEEAQADSDAKFKEQSVAIRGAEEEELAALRTEFDGKVERATASYEAKVERVFTGRHTFETKTHEKIDGLRAQKAQTADPAQKEAIQAQITTFGDQIAAKREEEKKKRADLKAAFGEQKEEIHAAEAKQETEIGEAAEEKVEKSSRHWKRAYEEKKATLGAKRDSQLRYLETKLEKGRADIASMPAA